MKEKAVPDANSRNVEEIIIPPEKRVEILDELRQKLWNGTHKMSTLWNNSKFVTKNGSK